MATFKMAVAGKGGTGKTTFAALSALLLSKTKYAPVLGIDADPNSNLDEYLGVTYPQTVSDVLQHSRGLRDVPKGMDKAEMVRFELQKCVVETSNLDLLVMGRPEGVECYCAANNMLRTFVSELASSYRSVVYDNEAGMEHLSRRTAADIDVLFVISDPSRAGIRAADRIYGLVKSLALPVKKSYLVLNRAAAKDLSALEGEVRECELDLAGVVPDDEAVSIAESSGKPLGSVLEGSIAAAAIKEILIKRIPS